MVPRPGRDSKFVLTEAGNAESVNNDDSYCALPLPPPHHPHPTSQCFDVLFPQPFGFVKSFLVFYYYQTLPFDYSCCTVINVFILRACLRFYDALACRRRSFVGESVCHTSTCFVPFVPRTKFLFAFVHSPVLRRVHFSFFAFALPALKA